MNSFLKKTNGIRNKKNTIVIIIFLLSLFLWFTFIQERKISEFYKKKTYYDESMKLKDIQYAIKNDFTEDDILNEQKISDTLLEKFQSLVSEDQRVFLQAEIDNQQLNQELTDKFENLSYVNYISGKIMVNNYLITHHLPLKSLNYSTDSAIFTMNVLEFLNTPLFFLTFFLLMPITYFKKYEDGRINFLLVQPIRRSQIVWLDYKLFISNIMFVLFFTAVSASSLAFLLSRSFTIDYPVLLTVLGVTKIVPIYQYLLVLSTSFFFIGTFIFLLTYFCVLLSKKTMVAIFVTIFICFSWNLFISHYGSNLNVINPFTYVNIESLSKSKDTDAEVRYVEQTERNINITENLVVGNVVENPYYYANNSIAIQIETVDSTLLPFVLTLFSLTIFGINVYLLNRY